EQVPDELRRVFTGRAALGTYQDKMDEYESTGEVAALEEAVAALRTIGEGVEDDDDPWLPSNLSAALGTLYDHVGDPALLDEAIDLARAALALIPPEEVTARSVMRRHLGGSLLVRFIRSGDVGSLDEATRLLRELLAEAPPDDRHRASDLANLATATRARFDRFRDAEALDEALGFARQALELTPPGH